MSVSMLRGVRHISARLSLCPSNVFTPIPEPKVSISVASIKYTPLATNTVQTRFCSHHPTSSATKPVKKQTTASYSTKITPEEAAVGTPSESSLSNPKESSAGKMAGKPDDTYSVVFESNSSWRRSLAQSHPGLFDKLSQAQKPEILWIGCADSRCPETTILGLQPGDIFCHRNIANILVPTDLNSLSVIEYATRYLQVKHIIVCGHTSCGGVAAALDNKKLGAIDTWLMPLRHIRAKNAKMLDSLPEKERALKLVDLNVRNSVDVLLENPVVLEAMFDRGLQVHGLIYNIATGELDELDITHDDEIMKERNSAFKIA